MKNLFTIITAITLLLSFCESAGGVTQMGCDATVEGTICQVSADSLIFEAEGQWYEAEWGKNEPVVVGRQYEITLSGGEAVATREIGQ